MALTFPLPLAQFFDRLPVEDMSFTAPPQTESSRTAGGEEITRRLGPSLWTGSVNLYNLPLDCGSGIEGLISSVSEPGGSFLIYNRRRAYPMDDPAGQILGAATPKLAAVASNGDVSLSGLPALYWLRAGDLFGFSYGTNPVRYAVHRVVQEKRATSGGAIAGLIVHPPVQPGWSANSLISLVKPPCKAKIISGSPSEGMYGRLALSGLSFRWQQTLR